MGLGHLGILHLFVIYLLDNRVCCTGSLVGTLASFVTGAAGRLTATCATESVVRVLRLEDQVPAAPLCEALDGVVTKVSSRSNLPGYTSLQPVGQPVGLLANRLGRYTNRYW
jgi:hypothetical protein